MHTTGLNKECNSIQLFHTFLCNRQNYHPLGAVDDPMPKAEGNSTLGHPKDRGDSSFDCCTERYEILVLLPNSEHTKCTDPEGFARGVQLNSETIY